VLAAVLCAAAQFVVTAVILLGGRLWLPAPAFGMAKLVAFASTVILPLALAWALGLWRDLGFAWSRVRLGPVFIASLVPAALMLAAGIHAGSYTGGGFFGEAGVQVVNAFGEELLFRGVIFALLMRLPAWRGIVLSGVLFGSMHLLHGFMGDPWSAALGQAAITALAGMMFAAVRYATGSLWLVIVLHVATNLAMIYSNVEIAWGEDAFASLQRLANLMQVVLALWVAGTVRQVAEAANGQ